VEPLGVFLDQIVVHFHIDEARPGDRSQPAKAAPRPEPAARDLGRTGRGTGARSQKRSGNSSSKPLITPIDSQIIRRIKSLIRFIP
jgi:hypothetical protein